MNLVGQGGESLDGPAFVGVGGAGYEDGVIICVNGVRGKFAVDGVGGDGVNGQYEPCGRFGGACDPGHLEVVINKVDAVAVMRNFMRVKKVCEFSGELHAEAIPAAGEPGDGGCSEQALKIEYGVESV